MIYKSSSGEYYSGLDIWMRFESGLWAPYDWEHETGKEWVSTEAGDIITLTPISESELPEGISVTEISDIDPVDGE